MKKKVIGGSCVDSSPIYIHTFVYIVSYIRSWKKAEN